LSAINLKPIQISHSTKRRFRVPELTEAITLGFTSITVEHKSSREKEKKKEFQPATEIRKDEIAKMNSVSKLILIK
jgi:hypothetical protein